MATKITQATIQRARPAAKPYEISGQFKLVLRVQPSGVKTFYCQWGRHKRMRLGDANVLTIARAEYLARAALNETADEGSPLRRDPKKSSLGGFIEAHYTPWLRANRKRAEKTLLDLKRCFEPLYAKRLTAISGSDLDDYVAARRGEGRSAATIVRDLNNLRSVLRLALERRYLREHPFRGWRKPKVEDNGVTRYLSPEEEGRLRAALAERDEEARRERASANEWRAERGYALLSAITPTDYPDHLTPMTLLSLNSGLRFGELAALEWPAVDMRARVLTVRAATAKGAKTRHVPLNAEALDVLARWRAQGAGAGLVFPGPNGSRIASIKTSWAGVLKRARISGFRWHDLRHTFASKLVQRGVDLAVVRELLGHGDFSLTLRYAHLEPKQRAEAVARLAA
jgi:integrase